MYIINFLLQHTQAFVGNSFVFTEQIIAQAKLLTKFTIVTVGWIIGLQVGRLHMFHHLHLVAWGLLTSCTSPSQPLSVPALAEVRQSPRAKCFVGCNKNCWWKPWGRAGLLCSLELCSKRLSNNSLLTRKQLFVDQQHFKDVHELYWF